MKIGMVLDQIFPPDHRVEKEAISLSQNGHDVFLLCLRQRRIKSLRNHEGISVVSIYIPMFIIKKLRALTNTIFNFYPYLWFFFIRRFIKKYQIEALHIHDLYMFKSGLLANKNNMPIIGDLHENYVDALREYRFSTTFPGNILINIDKWRVTEHQWINQMDYIITVVEEMRTRVKPFLKRESDAIVINNSVDIDSFLNYKRDDKIVRKFRDQFVVSYIGGFDLHRGLNTLVDAIFKIQHYSDLTLLIVGQMNKAGHIREQILELGIEDRVVFESFKPIGVLQNYFYASDIGIIPHLKSVQTDNSSPNKLYQYMLMAKPVIVSNCNSIMNVIESEKAGLVFRSGDADDLADKISQIYIDKKLGKDLGKNGKNAVYETYNWKANAKKINNLYSRIEKG